MTSTVSFVIPRHAVPSDPATGLSPLQARMLEDPAAVRIFSAPTGAGKSYAFQKAMREKNARILFIVPTRRLAQNLAEGLTADLQREGVSEEEAKKRIFLWTSDGALQQKAANPEIKVRDLRISQIRAEILPALAAGGLGFMIFATPESVALYLLNAGLRGDGRDPENIFDFLRLDHIVFDEFHTIDARGMGLSCALSSIASRIGGAAKITFLSATPIDVKTTLVGFGIAAEAVVAAQETVKTGSPQETQDMRAIHGDVHVSLSSDAADLPALLEANKEKILANLARTDTGRQVVVIYDSVRQLLHDKQSLAVWFDKIGVGPQERLSINSSDDSVEREMDGFFTIGRLTDPLDFKVLIATSSVEMGVTFKAGLLLMEPGHDSCSFVQRLGRAARGDIPGEVVVLANDGILKRSAWLRNLPKLLSAEGERIPVDRFTELVLQSTRKKFDAKPEELAAELAEDEKAVFRKMPQSAIWAAALFWAALERSAHYKGLGESLRNFRPSQAATISGKIRDLEKSRLDAAKDWAKALLGEAKRLRMILPKVMLVDPEGRKKSIPWLLYASTEALTRSPASVDENGALTVQVDRPISMIEGSLGGSRVERREEALWPHVGRTTTLPLQDIDLEWRKNADNELDAPQLSAEQENLLKIAISLVRLTRIVPIAPQEAAAHDAILID